MFLLFFNYSRTVYWGVQHLTGEAQKKFFFAMFPGTKISLSTAFCHFKTLFVVKLGPQQTIFHGYSVCGAPFFIQIK